MTEKVKSVAGASAPAPARALLPGPWLTQAWTLEERLHRIEAMGQKIDGYVRFMCQVGRLDGASTEVKEQAVTAFYERMVIVEKQLGCIHENLRLQ